MKTKLTNTIYFLIFLILFSCNRLKDKDERLYFEDVKKIKTGMSSSELKLILKEPFLKEVNSPKSDTWHFVYYHHGSSLLNYSNLEVYLANDTIVDFKTR